jgi:hypothetical protein
LTAAAESKTYLSNDYYDGAMVLDQSSSSNNCSGSSFIDPETVDIDFRALQYSLFITTIVAALSAYFFFLNAWYIRFSRFHHLLKYCFKIGCFPISGTSSKKKAAVAKAVMGKTRMFNLRIFKFDLLNFYFDYYTPRKRRIDAKKSKSKIRLTLNRNCRECETLVQDIQKI